VAGTAVRLTGTVASGRTALVRSGIALALAGMAAVIGTAAGIAEVGNIMIVTVAGGELVPREVSVLALDYSGERSQRLPITSATTIATITPLMPVRLDLRFGIGAISIRATTLRYSNARFPGEKLFSNGLEISQPFCGLSEMSGAA